MRISALFPLAAALLALAPLALPQEMPDREAPSTSVGDRAALEAEFVRMLNGCRLVGSYTRDGQADSRLREDSYVIRSFTKLEGDDYRIAATMSFGGNVTLPITVQVRWAGDTPVLMVTDLGIPMIGTYTARIVFYGKKYAGTWDGRGYGGHLFGRVEPLEAAAAGRDAGGAGAGAGGGTPGGSGAGAGGGRTDGGESGGGSGGGEDGWTSFHGPQGRGVAETGATPVAWNVETGENVRWRTAIPGLAHSSPVVAGGKLFVTTAVREGGDAELRVGLYGSIAPVDDEGVHALQVLCLDAKSGAILWTQTAWRGVPAIKRHPKGSHAASTPATDGKNVVAFFGSEGLYCYDADGNLRWSKDLGRLDSGYYVVKDAQWGFASSPVIADDRVVVQCDVQEGSFLAAYALADGGELWRTPREEVPTWGTPTVDLDGGRRQIVVNGYRHIGGYDFDTGDELWRLAGGGDIPVPTPVITHDLVFITNAHGRQAPIYAIALDADGELTDDPSVTDAMVWSRTNLGNYMQTPIVYGEELYMCADQGILACYDVGTGEQHYRERLGGGTSGFTSSGVATDGKLYFASETGEVYVVPAGLDFEVASVNPLGETCMASPAIWDGALFYRTRGHVLAIGE